MNEQLLHAFLDKVMADAAGAASMPMVLVGTRLGFYEALKRKPMTAAALARKTDTFARYVTEWAHQQAASGYLDYDPQSGRYSLNEQQAFCLANEDSPLNLFAVSEFLAAMFAATERAVDNFKTGTGMHWGEHHPCLFHAQEYFNRATYLNELVPQWMPALGLDARLRDGVDVADVGCGHGLTTLILAQAYPNSRFIGFDNHAASIKTARGKARKAGLKNLRFELADATAFDGDFDLVACFECFHDMGDPAGVARHARAVLRKGGLFVVADPNASDNPVENYHALGRMFYAGSTFMCCPASRALGGPALGAQAGPARTLAYIRKGGFKQPQLVHTTPFFMLLSAAK